MLVCIRPRNQQRFLSIYKYIYAHSDSKQAQRKSGRHGQQNVASTTYLNQQQPHEYTARHTESSDGNGKTNDPNEQSVPSFKNARTLSSTIYIHTDSAKHKIQQHSTAQRRAFAWLDSTRRTKRYADDENEMCLMVTASPRTNNVRGMSIVAFGWNSVASLCTKWNRPLWAACHAMPSCQPYTLSTYA